MKLYLYLLVSVCCFVANGWSQTINNVRAETSRDIVNIYYDLESPLEGQIYQVFLYSSHNDMARPLSYVSGDVGSNVTAGTIKKIEWQAKKELIRFTGEITFEVQATLVFSPISIKNPATAVAYKRGKTYPLSWQGGIANENLTLELYQGENKLADIIRIPNTHHFQWQVPSNTKPGKGYKIKISSTEKPENFRLSPPFTINRKVPTLVKLLPLGILAGAVVYILTNTGSNPGHDPVKPSAVKLPGPPEVPQ